MSASSKLDSSDTISRGLNPYSYVPPRDASLENHLARHLKKMTRIGAALSVEKNIHKLLEMIVDEAKSLTNADAGTLYILDKEKKTLQFQILQTDAMGVRLGGTSGAEINLPNVPLYDDKGEPNHANVSSYTALTGETISIPDVYDAEGFDFSGTRNYDQSTGYRSKSMLVLAMNNHENETIGVLQLLNAQDLDTGEVVSFPPEYIELVVSLASQGAVALTNTQLIQNLTDLFYAFIKSIATAMDEKSPYTGGHISRVVDLTMMIAREINGTDQAPFQDTCLSDDEMEELRLAAWMHDVGKITTPEVIVDKATKLQAFVDRIEWVETRFDLIAATIENDYLRQKLVCLSEEKQDPQTHIRLEEDMAEQIARVRMDFDFLRNINNAVEFMDDEKLERLHDIAKKTYQLNGRRQPYLTENEVLNLGVRKGNLTDEERRIIENHVEVTYKMLDQLPFPKKHAMVPEYAAGHHEKLDGSGYPRHLKKSELPLQSRIMAVADIFEALTAKDRPYKEPMTISQAIKILSFMKKDGHIDPDIHDLVVNSNLLLEYAKTFMNPDQIDGA
jgi:HD-GYP domain-containing protein (c-di-GMP phosphodiesterase class II)